MAKKKSKSPLGEGVQTLMEEAGPAISDPGTSVSSETPQTSLKTAAKGAPNASSQPLIICRNKHWRYISSFHGPWLQVPFEILESMANINYNTPRPRPIDPAVVFDLVKIRRLVDEASNLAVRAASEIASPTLTNVNGGVASAQESLSAAAIAGPGHGSKMSRERKFRMREQASQKLARAYRLDEIACSVAVMQGATSLEDVGNLVLQRNPQDPDAKYVQFFHEKIPSRKMAESTSLQPLTDILSERPNEVEVLRTRATVKLFKDDYDGATQDLNQALSGCRFHQPPSPTGEGMQLHESRQGHRRVPDVILAEKDQPSSLEDQLMFHRATTYLTLACQHLIRGRWTSPRGYQTGNEDTQNGTGESEPDGKVLNDPVEAPTKDQLESRKLIKTFAKRALRDYLTFISRFEYSPNLPSKVIMDFNERLCLAERRGRNTRPSDAGSPIEPYTTYSLDTLFAALPPSDLPPYPSQEIEKTGSRPSRPPKTYEFITYHPLLTDALHSLLLCHCLVQTSPKELLRHAYMAARLIRITDSSPVFHPSRPSSRTDWIEVVRRGDNWLQLSTSWEILTENVANDACYNDDTEAGAMFAVGAMMSGYTAEKAIEQRRLENLREEALRNAISDDRVHDNASLRAAISDHTKRLTEELCRPNRSERSSGHLKIKSQEDEGSESFEKDPAIKSPTTDIDALTPADVATLQEFRKHFPKPNGKNEDITPEEYSKAYDAAMRDYLNDMRGDKHQVSDDEPGLLPPYLPRASAIAEWIREAPVVPTTSRRKKRSKKGKEVSDEAMEQMVDSLDLGESPGT